MSSGGGPEAEVGVGVEARAGAHRGKRSTSCTSGIRRSIAIVRASAVTSPASAAARACFGLGLGLARGEKPPCYYA